MLIYRMLSKEEFSNSIQQVQANKKSLDENMYLKVKSSA